jgi:hypothetical protein
MTFGTFVRMLSGVGVVAGLMGAAGNTAQPANFLYLAAFSFLVFMTAVCMKIESR